MPHQFASAALVTCSHLNLATGNSVPLRPEIGFIAPRAATLLSWVAVRTRHNDKIRALSDLRN